MKYKTLSKMEQRNIEFNISTLPLEIDELQKKAYAYIVKLYIGYCKKYHEQSFWYKHYNDFMTLDKFIRHFHYAHRFYMRSYDDEFKLRSGGSWGGWCYTKKFYTLYGTAEDKIEVHDVLNAVSYFDFYDYGKRLSSYDDFSLRMKKYGALPIQLEEADVVLLEQLEKDIKLIRSALSHEI